MKNDKSQLAHHELVTSETKMKAIDVEISFNYQNSKVPQKQLTTNLILNKEGVAFLKFKTEKNLESINLKVGVHF